MCLVPLSNRLQDFAKKPIKRLSSEACFYVCSKYRESLSSLVNFGKKFNDAWEITFFVVSACVSRLCFFVASPGSSSPTRSLSGSPLGGSSVVSSAANDKINIHVSVTINTPQNGNNSQGLNAGSSPLSGTTLADLKKARSMSRSIASPSTAAGPTSPPPALPEPPPVPSHHHRHHNHPLPSSSFSSIDSDVAPGDDSPVFQVPDPRPSSTGNRTSSAKRTSGKPKGSRSKGSSPERRRPNDAANVQKFSATNEVVGPPPKSKGCCKLM